MADWPHKLDHLGLPVTDLDASVRFYRAALAPVGISQLGAGDRHAAFGIGAMPYLIIRLAAAVSAPVHVAFIADQRADVDAFHAAAVAAGGADNGVAGLRPDYHAAYYAAFVLDPDGHNIEVVKHTPE
ncbi:MAG: VOC family protein [Gammaproteobacteria bacterium]